MLLRAAFFLGSVLLTGCHISTAQAPTADDLAAYAARRNARAEELHRAHPDMSGAQIEQRLAMEFPAGDAIPSARPARKSAEQSKFEDDLSALPRKKQPRP